MCFHCLCRVCVCVDLQRSDTVFVLSFHCPCGEDAGIFALFVTAPLCLVVPLPSWLRHCLCLAPGEGEGEGGGEGDGRHGGGGESGSGSEGGGGGGGGEIDSSTAKERQAFWPLNSAFLRRRIGRRGGRGLPARRSRPSGPRPNGSHLTKHTRQALVGVGCGHLLALVAILPSSDELAVWGALAGVGWRWLACVGVC